MPSDSSTRPQPEPTPAAPAVAAAPPPPVKVALPGETTFVYWIVSSFFRLLGRYWLRLEVHHPERVPAHGPFLLLPTHCSFLDPPLAGSVLGYMCHFLAREGILKVPLLGPLCARLNAHPIRQGAGDREAIRVCRTVLKEGKPLVFFPEGTRSRDGLLGPLQKGWVMILDGSPGVPYLPVVMQETFNALPRGKFFIRPAKVHVTVGEPVLLPARQEGESTRDFYDRCAADLERRYRELGAK